MSAGSQMWSSTDTRMRSTGIHGRHRSSAPGRLRNRAGLRPGSAGPQAARDGPRARGRGRRGERRIEGHGPGRGAARSRPRVPGSRCWRGAGAALDETVAALDAAGSPDAIGIVTDLTVRDEVDAAFARDRRRGGASATCSSTRPDRSRSGSAGSRTSTTTSGWRRSTSGRSSAARCVRAALPLLRAAEWARIVNVSAHSTKRQSPDLVAYTASKAALTSLTKNLSLSLAADGILVNTVSPGSFLSEGMRGVPAVAAGRARTSTPTTSATRCASSRGLRPPRPPAARGRSRARSAR